MNILKVSYTKGLLILSAVLILTLTNPLVTGLMVSGCVLGYVVHWLVQHPDNGHLLARVVAESVGLLLILSIFVGFLLIFSQLIGA